MAHIQRRLEKSNCKGKERETLEFLLTKLKEGIPARSCDLSPTDQFSIKSMGLLTLKPVIYAFNVNRHDFLFDRDNVKSNAIEAVTKIPYSDTSRDLITLVSAKMESRLAKLSIEKQLQQMHEHGVDSSMDKDIKDIMCYNSLPTLIQKLLGLGLLYTGPGVPTGRSNATKSYTFRLAEPPTAFDLAGKIHHDIQKGFIKAEVVPAPILLQYEDFYHAREAGLVRTEGKDHELKNHDVVFIKWK